MPESVPPSVTSDVVAAAPVVPAGGHLSIGEVLALLLEEFPDVTISKIRFLESQGLIDPERTASGYRKFYADDVELLRCILREQRENYLPLRVIKDRIDSGEIDPTNEHPRPRGIKNVSETSDVPRPDTHPSAGGARHASESNGADEPVVTGAAALFQRTDGEPSTSAGDAQPPAAAAPAPAAAVTTSAAVLPGVLLSADELCAMAGIGRDQLADLMSYGVLTSTSNRPEGPFDDEAVEIASASKLLLDAGLEARHLRGWRVAADREAGLLEQLIQPLLRQRNPEARAQAVSQLNELEQVGSRLRSALMRSALHHHGTP
ncbi:MAG: MerR family transcriptional regulator [Ilumatobacteraceae bacterium]|jgi:DNA-binding transcriptional MerR regulator